MSYTGKPGFLFYKIHDKPQNIIKSFENEPE